MNVDEPTGVTSGDKKKLDPNASSTLEEECKNSSLYSWSQGLETCKEAPSIIYLCPTNYCNHGCCTCGYSHMRKGVIDGVPQRGYMDFSLFQKIVRELPTGFRRVYLQKTGEPLLHPQIKEMMQFLHEEKPEYERAIHTNCTMLKNNLFPGLIEHMNFVSLSVFGFDEKSYFKAHGANHFKKVISNLSEFHSAWSKSPPGRRPKVYFDVVRNNYNKHLSDREIFDFLHQRFPHFNIGIHFPFNFLGFVKDYDNSIFQNLNQKHFPRCVHPWDMMTILWDGKVGYCVGDPLEKAILGDLSKESVMSAWNNKDHKEFRRRVIQGKWDELEKNHIYCSKCNWNFALSSQNMSNLCMANRYKYKNEKEVKHRPSIYGNEHLKDGFISFLKGELAEALGSFSVAGIVSDNSDIQKKAGIWKKNIKTAYDSKKNMKHWEKALKKEGLSLSTIHNSAYFISSELSNDTEKNHYRLKDGKIIKKVCY